MNWFTFVALLLSFTPSVFCSQDSENNYKMHWAAHGSLASIAWAILIPLGIGSALLHKEFVKLGFSEGFWFQLHRGLNLLAVILTIIAFAIAVYVIKEEDGELHLKEDPHFLVGTVIFLAAFLQAMFALLRPSLPHKEEKKGSVENMDDEDTETKDVESTKQESTGKESKEIVAAGEKGDEISTHKESEVETLAVGGEKKSLLRRAWEANHRLFGVGLLAMAWWQIYSGWELFETEIGGKDLGKVFLGVAGGISGIIVLVYVVQKIRAAHA
jgi:hypothetical protein